MKIWTVASWGQGKCFSSETFLESKALKLINICARSLVLNGGCGCTYRFLTVQHQPWHTGASHSSGSLWPSDSTG